MSLDRLAEAVRMCAACPLGTQGRGVPGMMAGVHPAASGEDLVMVLGEAPGGVEQIQGKPFVGGSGKLLHSLLKECGLTVYYVSNIVRHRPPVVKGKQQAPDKVAIEACAPFLRAEFDLVKPTKLLLLGKTAAKLVVDGNFSMGKVVNQTYEYGGVPTLVLMHPAYFLHSRTAPWIQKQLADWKRSLRMFLGERPPEYRVEQVHCPTHSPS